MSWRLSIIVLHRNDILKHTLKKKALPTHDVWIIVSSCVRFALCIAIMIYFTIRKTDVQNNNLTNNRTSSVQYRRAKQ